MWTTFDKGKTKSIAYQCKAIAEKLQTAFGIDTSGDDLHIHPESMCKCCKLSMDRVISAMKNMVHHRSAVVLFQWEKHSNQKCKVKGVRGEHVTKTAPLQMCEHFHASAKGGNPKGARPTTGRGRIPGATPNMIIARINSIAPPPINLPEHAFPRPPLSKDNLSVSVLNQLECPLCVDILAQPSQLPCSTLACAQCIIQWVVTTASVHCPCCFLQQPIVLPLLQPASHLVLPLLKDVVVHCVSCSRDMRAGAYEEHECVLTLTASEERAAAGLLKRAISTKGIIQLGTGGTVSVFNVNNTQCLPLML